MIDANAKALRVSDEAVRKRPLAKVSLRMVCPLDIANMSFLFVTANGRNISGQRCWFAATWRPWHD